ncbi:hypothetical protein LCGC14_1939430 [marine sediment metagenome]|uniref:Uncharacterized protein n=1 Tax=marine sediment metagenome TaxID=412755 RepID=A0A0F9FL13_9ZZZZ
MSRYFIWRRNVYTSHIHIKKATTFWFIAHSVVQGINDLAILALWPLMKFFKMWGRIAEGEEFCTTLSDVELQELRGRDEIIEYPFEKCPKNLFFPRWAKGWLIKDGTMVIELSDDYLKSLENIKKFKQEDLL